MPFPCAKARSKKNWDNVPKLNTEARERLKAYLKFTFQRLVEEVLPPPQSRPLSHCTPHCHRTNVPMPHSPGGPGGPGLAYLQQSCMAVCLAFTVVPDCLLPSAKGT